MISIVLFSVVISFVTSLDYSICNAYTQLEATTPCGPQGYALNYGLPICKAFINNEQYFTPRGKVFLDCVRPCLANFVTANITGVKKITDCTAIKDTAFSSHVPCYKKCNFCGIVISNLLQFAITFKVSDFLSEIAIEQVLQVAEDCLSDPINFLTGR